jgi:hypothetical protein
MRARLDKIVKGFEKTVTKLDKLTGSIRARMEVNVDKMDELAMENEGLGTTFRRAEKIRSNVANLIAMD